jgi:hypothetical protein
MGVRAVAMTMSIRIYPHIDVNKCYIVDSQQVKCQHRGQQTFLECYIVYYQELKGQH